MKKSALPAILAIALALSGCDTLREKPALSEGHLDPSPKETASTEGDSSAIPEPVYVAPSLPPPAIVQEETTHTVVVYDVPVSELLFSLSRDSELNLDIDSAIDARITLNAVDQPLQPLLDRIAESANLRYEIKDGVLKVRRDLPFLRSYEVDYLNMSRSSLGQVGVSTEIRSTGGTAGASTGDSAGNSSDTMVNNASEHAFWDSLYQNIENIIYSGVTEEGAEEGANPNIIMNRESGVLAVRATGRQHAEISRFIDSVVRSSQRQVLIEATIAEVKLSDSYQAGVDWTLINTDKDIIINQNVTDPLLGLVPPAFTLDATDINIGNNNIAATLTALETFGDVSVMSSPKVMAINNQTALLKVVDNIVYFVVEVNIDNASATVGGGRLFTFETEINTVPVGFVMSVTPFINMDNSVTLNVRPTISRVIDFVEDPNPQLAEAGVTNEIPVIQVREVESVLKVDSGDIAVIGGLMQDEIQRESSGVPVLSSLPGVGSAFRYDNDKSVKTELVIFIRPRVIGDASLEGDLDDFQRFLPGTAIR